MGTSMGKLMWTVGNFMGTSTKNWDVWWRIYKELGFCMGTSMSEKMVCLYFLWEKSIEKNEDFYENI